MFPSLQARSRSSSSIYLPSIFLFLVIAFFNITVVVARPPVSHQPQSHQPQPRPYTRIKGVQVRIGRVKEADLSWLNLAEEYPDYLFAVCISSRICFTQKNDEVKELLLPIAPAKNPSSRRKLSDTITLDVIPQFYSAQTPTLPTHRSVLDDLKKKAVPFKENIQFTSAEYATAALKYLVQVGSVREEEKEKMLRKWKNTREYYEFQVTRTLSDSNFKASLKVGRVTEEGLQWLKESSTESRFLFVICIANQDCLTRKEHKVIPVPPPIHEPVPGKKMLFNGPLKPLNVKPSFYTLRHPGSPSYPTVIDKLKNLELKPEKKSEKVLSLEFVTTVLNRLDQLHTIPDEEKSKMLDCWKHIYQSFVPPTTETQSEGTVSYGGTGSSPSHSQSPAETAGSSQSHRPVDIDTSGDTAGYSGRVGVHGSSLPAVPVTHNAESFQQSQHQVVNTASSLPFHHPMDVDTSEDTGSHPAEGRTGVTRSSHSAVTDSHQATADSMRDKKMGIDFVLN